MVVQLLGLAFVYLTTSLHTLSAHGLYINHTGEVEYRDTSVYGVVDQAVILGCGTEVPDLYIWSFTKPGTEAIKAVVYDLGKGPKIQKLAKTLGQLTIISNNASVRIENLPLAAHGLFTCQAFYDIDEEPIVYYHYVHLTVQVPVSKPYLLMSNASPVEGSTISIHCRVENGTEPIQYVWQHESNIESIKNFTQSNSSIINVTNIDRNHTGWYHCVASNTVNSERSDKLWLDIKFGPDVPQIDVSPYSVTEEGYSALETYNVSLFCQAQSNPDCQYVWLYNNSQVYTGPQFTITNILRMHTGNYTCMAHNSFLNTSSRKTISLTVFYPPDGSPSCSVEPALNHTSLRVLCSWPGGSPSPSLHWTGDLKLAGRAQLDGAQLTNPLNSTVILLPSESLNSNNSLFTCIGSHPALKDQTQCSTRAYIPPAEPVCFFSASSDLQYLTLSCFWDGGNPEALVWWEGSEDQRKDGEENSNILVLRYGTARSGKPYTCYAQHPLLVQTKTCGLTLVPVSTPNLLMSDASPVEGSTLQMHCNVKTGTEPIQYVWQYAVHWGNFTTFAHGSSRVNVTNIERNHTGWYRCVASNAVNSESSDRSWLNITFGPDYPQIDVTPYNITEWGYSALETENVSLLCQAQSNPDCQYIWFYNNAQVYTGPELVITKILRIHTGNYTCMAHNPFLNTSSRKTISLTVFYPPGGSPSCSVEPALNHTSLKLLCSWPGGFPSPSLRWTGNMTHAEQDQVNTGQPTNLLTSTNILLHSGGLIPNNSLFTCLGSHPALQQQRECSTLTYIPPEEPLCFANVTNDKQFLMLSCSWDGGAPKALVWWEGPDGQVEGGEEKSSILMHYNTFHFGKAYICHARHPLLVQTKTCRLTLVPVNKPYLLMSDGTPVEGSRIWMQCNLVNGTEPIQYVWQYEARGGRITTFEQGNNTVMTIPKVNRNHTGWYRCVASNDINSEHSDKLWLDVVFGPDDPQIDVSPYIITERGYSALEAQSVSLLCQAQSNPASQYIWFYNNSQVYTGPQFSITKILRVHTGDYTCLAQNTFLNTRSRKTISLVVYYPPDGTPSCSVEPALNHTFLKLLCSWPGGSPSPSLHWTRDRILSGQDQADAGQQTNTLTGVEMLLPAGGLIPNNSLFMCIGSHPALKDQTQCSTSAYIPPADPVCFAYVTNNQQYLMLSCSWDGGAPKALVWWEGPEGANKGGQENSNILVLRYGTARSGKPYTCYAQHPLLVQTKTCRLTLEAPVLLTQRRVVSVYEGSDVQLTCNLRSNYLPSNEITWFNNQGADVRDTSKYMLLRTSAWANLTVRDTEETQDSGEYRCSTSNAVGGAEINVTLVVKKHPMPPNATLVKVGYNSRQRNEVELEWQVESEDYGGWTGFFLEHRWISERPGRRGSSNESKERIEEKSGSQDWYRTIIGDPDARSHTLRGLTPTVKYQFRITPVNHRTIGHPSAAKTPVEQSNNVYPAVIGAAIGGMLFAAIPTLLLLVYIIRNRNNSPGLHDLLFGSKRSQSRENINFPEDEVAGRSQGGVGDSGGSGQTVAGPQGSSSHIPSLLNVTAIIHSPISDSQAPPTEN
ncbi:hemicentin-2-like [Menidia menidia]